MEMDGIKYYVGNELKCDKDRDNLIEGYDQKL